MESQKRENNDWTIENADNRMEIDFLIRRNRKICPIEVKSSLYQGLKKRRWYYLFASLYDNMFIIERIS